MQNATSGRTGKNRGEEGGKRPPGDTCRSPGSGGQWGRGWQSPTTGYSHFERPCPRVWLLISLNPGASWEHPVGTPADPDTPLSAESYYEHNRVLGWSQSSERQPRFRAGLDDKVHLLREAAPSGLRGGRVPSRPWGELSTKDSSEVGADQKGRPNPASAASPSPEGPRRIWLTPRNTHIIVCLQAWTRVGMGGLKNHRIVEILGERWDSPDFKK